MDVDWRLIAAFGSPIVAALSLLYLRHRNKKLDRQRQGTFVVYVIDSYRFKTSKLNGARILLVNASITNRANRPITFACSATIEYVSKDGVVHRAILAHDPELVKVLNNDSLSIFEHSVRVDSDGIATGWILLSIPLAVFEAMRIEKYTLRIEDTDKRTVDTSIYLVKDMTDENP